MLCIHRKMTTGIVKREWSMDSLSGQTIFGRATPIMAKNSRDLYTIGLVARSNDAVALTSKRYLPKPRMQRYETHSREETMRPFSWPRQERPLSL